MAQYISRETLQMYGILRYTLLMAKKQVLQIRLSASEKDGFQLAADLAGISLSSWVREKLRLAAIRDLESLGRPVPFIESIPFRSSDG